MKNENIVLNRQNSNGGNHNKKRRAGLVVTCKDFVELFEFLQKKFYKDGASCIYGNPRLID